MTDLNYNDRYPSLSFRLDRSLNFRFEKIANGKKISKTELARQIISKYLNKELIEQSEDLPTVLMKLRVDKLKAEIKYMEIKNNYFETFNQPMSRRAEIAIKPQIIKPQRIVSSMIDRFESHQSPYDAKNKRLQCVDCGSLFCWNSEQEFESQMQEFQRHLVSKHDRVKTEIERDVLIELKYEGDST